MAEKWKPNLLPFVDWVNQPMTSGQWLIPDLVPAESICIISGLPKQGFKTWLAMLVAQMCAGGIGYKSEKGGEWRKPSYPVPVGFFEEEGSGIASKGRLNKVALGLDMPIKVDKVLLPLPPGMKEGDPDRPYDWHTTPLGESPFFQNFYFAHAVGVKLDIEARLETLYDMVKTLKLKLVVFDALTYVFDGDENAKEVLAPVVDAMKQIRKLGATVMPLVHLRKDSGDEDIDKDLRGHTILRDAYDAHLGARRPKDRDAIVLHCRYRDGRRRKYELFWKIPDQADMGPVKLDMVDMEIEKKKLAQEKGPQEWFDMLLKKGCIIGASYPVSRFNEIWKVNPGKGAELRGILIEAGLLAPGPDGKISLV